MNDEKMQKAKPFNIEERAMDYTVRAVRLFRHLKSMRDDVASIVGRQYLRAATSIGANLVEARHGESRADFVHKCGVAQKEVREALYWVEVMGRTKLIAKSRLEPIQKETQELLSIIMAIIKTAKRNK
jgi:four helix bundle protein